MQHDFVPQALQRSFDQFLRYLEQLDNHQLTHCPYCAGKAFIQIRAVPLTFRCKGCEKYFNPLTNTAFNRLHPANWFKSIMLGRINLATYQGIADDLDCSIKMVIRRDSAIKSEMRIRAPSLYQWYINHNDIVKTSLTNDLPKVINAQHLALKQKINKLLATKKPRCLYCHSSDTVKVGQRTAFRCKDCRRSFNLLVKTPLNRLRDVDKWLAFIDLLVAKHNQNTIANHLGFDSKTIGHWRRIWCATMREWGFDSLAIWCQRKGSF